MTSTELALNTALKYVKRFEGLKLKPYLDPVGIQTIGYGITDKEVLKKYKNGMDEKTAHYLLLKELKTFATQVDDLVKVKLNANQKAALYSFVYNVGIGNFKKSTMLKLINENKLEQAATQFDRWTYASGKQLNGLINRRKTERELFELA
ncbi:lysozyme [Psittacicella hinzii]|uniref:Lysozyme n=1 Tax=Psittacicella hinzii TaxID=2028575 RepID=A0A3A1YD39_9GAMM|nr:lysozyme [Psittacicella hinzii]RIY35286.1 hypothetical protein CKF58_06830 [Psittacicella hinzii]